MDFDIPAEISAYLRELDSFIEREIRPLERENDNIRFFDHRREHARTDWDNDGQPRHEWEALLGEMRRRADKAGHLRFGLPKALGGKDGSNLAMAIIREHLAHKGLGLHNDLQNESSIVGNFPTVLMMRDFGTPEQQAEWMPGFLDGSRRLAFGLTEPGHGSDAVALETRARRDGDAWVLDGAKRWIGNASFADVVVIWARDEEGNVGGFLVPKGTGGFSASVMTGKASKRAVWQADVTLEGVRVPLDHRLAGSATFKDTARVLTATRFGVAWEAIGHAVAAYEAALAYVSERQQFGTPLSAFQLVQSKLAHMLAEITTMQLLTFRLSQLAAEGKMTDGQASLAKMNNAAKARDVVRDARDLMGGNGILLENHVARHQADMEAVFTYEGTDHIQSLIVGREITGQSAFTAPAGHRPRPKSAPPS
jgi:glutaryl-CoA dehydrogenase